jgi:hypothetical protein
MVLAHPAAALQRAAPVNAGARIRLLARGVDGLLVGTVTAAESDTLIVRVDGEGAGLIVPVDSILRLDVWGERAKVLEGVGVGVLGGVLLALVASPHWVDEYGECTTAPCLAYEISPNVGTRVAALSAVGALVGGIVGSKDRTSTWRSVRLQRVGVAPVSAGRLGVGVTLSF